MTTKEALEAVLVKLEAIAKQQTLPPPKPYLQRVADYIEVNGLSQDDIVCVVHKKQTFFK